MRVEKSGMVGRMNWNFHHSVFSILLRGFILLLCFFLPLPVSKHHISALAVFSNSDIGVLVISARKGEFETGYERGGQTREHVQLAKTLGVSKLLVVVNKMDEPTVKWSKERFNEIESKMVSFLKSSGYNVKKDVQFLPISGLLGTNMKTRVEKSVCPWWNGPCLFEALDAIEVPLRDLKGPFRMPIIDKFKDMGTVVMGKIESGSVRQGDSLLVMPNKVPVKVLGIYCDEDKVRRAGPGENLRVRVSGIEEEDIIAGFVMCSVAKPIHAVLQNQYMLFLSLLPAYRFWTQLIMQSFVLVTRLFYTSMQ
ncbi:UNVERIFIED_CONTAM: Eukaryotic peptide chain release factor GTP-binding subunit [Sesamum indicum]